MSRVHPTAAVQRPDNHLPAPKARLNGFMLLCFSTLLTGCARGQAPDFLILNSYFPSWLVGAIAATPVVVLLRYGLIRLGLDDYLPLRFFVYIALWLVLVLAFTYFYSPR